MACRACNRGRRTKSVSAYARAQRYQGKQPRIDLLGRALERLAASPVGPHANYGRRELELLARVA